MEEEVDELGDLKVIDSDLGFIWGVMIKPCCFVLRSAHVPSGNAIDRDNR